MSSPASQSNAHSSVRFLEIDSDQAGQRIDNFLITQLKGVPKSRIYRLIRKGEVRVNKGRIRVEYKLKVGDLVRIPPIRVAEQKAQVKPSAQLTELILQSLLYEDDDLYVLNKPTGMAVHGGSGINLGVIEVMRQIFENPKLELIHRIDRDTSGCLVIAKRRAVLRHVQDQFREKTVKKSYMTLVAGKWPRHIKQVDAPLLKNQLSSGERIVKVNIEGKPSVTNFNVLDRFESATLLLASPITGRTHQIRVHTQSVGHPIIGDDKYGDLDSNKALRSVGVKRLFLHAASIAFDLPSDNRRVEIEAPLPTDLSLPIEALHLKSANHQISKDSRSKSY
ncbi:MAG: 23S rRNA pseudouridine(955/2504/2580) synthase RluC [Cellvibrionaceae bacterium]